MHDEYKMNLEGSRQVRRKYVVQVRDEWDLNYDASERQDITDE